MHQEGLRFANSQPCNSSVFKVKLSVHFLFLHATLGIIHPDSFGYGDIVRLLLVSVTYLPFSWVWTCK
jgi:hypothetical protein